MRFLAIPFLVLAAAAIGGCDVCGDNECNFTKEEWQIVKTLSPLPEPSPDPTNRFSDPANERHLEAIELGKKLFFEPRYSAALKLASTLGAVGEAGKVSCESCHKANGNFVDNRSNPANLSAGVTWTTRNAPQIINQVYYDWHNWSGSRRTLWEQASFSPETGTNTAGDRCQYVHMLWDHYRDEYNAMFPDPLDQLPAELDPTHPEAARFPAKCRPNTTTPGAWEMSMTQADKDRVLRVMCNQGKMVATYESKLVSRNAPFDRYVAGDDSAISESAKRGLRLFVGKASCANCHLGPFFTDQKFHNVGVAQVGPNVPAMDQGRFASLKDLASGDAPGVPGKRPCRPSGPFSDDTSVDWDGDLSEQDHLVGAFRTGSLRNISQSAPYMHNGALASLRDVVEFYNRGGDDTGFAGTKHPRMLPLGLSSAEIDEIVAFLLTLTGEAVPEEYTSMPTLPYPPS